MAVNFIGCCCTLPLECSSLQVFFLGVQIRLSVVKTGFSQHQEQPKLCLCPKGVKYDVVDGEVEPGGRGMQSVWCPLRAMVQRHLPRKSPRNQHLFCTYLFKISFPSSPPLLIELMKRCLEARVGMNLVKPKPS